MLFHAVMTRASGIVKATGNQVVFNQKTEKKFRKENKSSTYFRKTTATSV